MRKFYWEKDSVNSGQKRCGRVRKQNYKGAAREIEIKEWTNISNFEKKWRIGEKDIKFGKEDEHYLIV